MTDHEAENIRTLFHDADLEHVPTSRDLIGPAVAWGDGRRRRDRWTAVGVVGAVTVAALAGVVALRPGHGTGSDAVPPGSIGTPTQSTTKPHTPAPTTAPTLPKLTGSVAHQEQEALDLLSPFLPAGVRITCEDVTQSPGYCTMLTITGPTGTSIAELFSGDQYTAPGTADLKYVHEHTATAAIPLVSGTKDVSGGTVRIESTDGEAQLNIKIPGALADPSARSFHTARYLFTSSVSGSSYTIELSELVAELPWKGAPAVPNAHAVFGFDQTGPVLSPEQFAALASAPIFPAALRALEDLRNQVIQSQTQSK